MAEGQTEMLFAQPASPLIMCSPTPELESYPRPDFYHHPLIWTSLNGLWQFCFDDDDEGLLQGWSQTGTPENVSRQIEVPFAFQTQASGINEQDAHEVLWYQRSIQEPRDANAISRHERVKLRFGAVDYECTIWLDGERLGFHRGGHTPFDIDLTEVLNKTALRSAHDLVIRVFDSATDKTQPRGKQYWGVKPEGIFYTPTSGIWQNVWLEVVPQAYIGDSSQGTVLRSDDVEEGTLHAEVNIMHARRGQPYYVELESRFHGLHISKTQRQELIGSERLHLDLSMRMTAEHMEILADQGFMDGRQNEACWLNRVALWSPEFPLLYDVVIRLFDDGGQVLDEVWTSTGMRSLHWLPNDGTFRLNGMPYFHALVLDQGYWPASGMTPPDHYACRRDVELAKELGFNGCRKHQKVEDPLFLYWADRLGFMVWGEMASAHEFGSTYTDRFDGEWCEMVRRDMNHPCVTVWTNANESWGYADVWTNTDQRNHLRSLYHQTKTIDPSRPVNNNCGWEHAKTDLATFHDYGTAMTLRSRVRNAAYLISTGRRMFLPRTETDLGQEYYQGIPILCTEFGGINIAPDGRDPYHKHGWGYVAVQGRKELLARVEDMCAAVTDSDVVCGFVWTQLTDIEQETNGLLTADRESKVDAEAMKTFMEEITQAYLVRHGVFERSVRFIGELSACRGFRLEAGYILHAECPLNEFQHKWRSSKIDLNDCLTNTFGKIGWAKGGNFKASSRHIKVVDGIYLEAEAGDGRQWIRNKLRLDERIRNCNGFLQFKE